MELKREEVARLIDYVFHKTKEPIMHTHIEEDAVVRVVQDL